MHTFSDKLLLVDNLLNTNLVDKYRFLGPEVSCITELSKPCG